MKRHNNRRREQRHNKSYEFALGLRCQAAVQLLGAMAEQQEEDGGFEPYYAAQQGLAAFAPARFTAHYQPHQFGLAAGFTPAEVPPNVAAAAMAAEQQALYQPVADFEQQQQYQGAAQDFEQQQQFQPAQSLAGLLDRWQRCDCPAPTGSPQHSPNDVSGGGQSEGTTATAGTGQHSSPNASPSVALAAAAAVAAGTAAAAAASAGDAVVGTPTSQRGGGLRRVSATRALEALRALNSTHSIESSDWDDESEDGSRSPAPWQRRGTTRLQAGSRLRAAGGGVSASGGAPYGGGPQDFVAPHLGHLMPQHLLEGVQGAQGFRADLPNLHPASMQQQQQGQWGGDYSGDVQGWEATLAAHLQEQQQQHLQEQHWGSAYDGSCGGAGTLTGSAGGASYDQTYVSGPPMAHNMSSAGGCCASGLMQQQAGLGIQHSAPAGLCYHSRSNSPAISTGGTAPAGFAAGSSSLGPSLLGAGLRAAAGPAPGLAAGACLNSQWSLPAQQHDFYGAPAGGDGPMQLQDHQLAGGQHGAGAAGPLLSSLGMQQGAEGPAFGSMQPHELQQVLQGLMPAGLGGNSPPEVPMGCGGSTAPGLHEAPNPAACGPAETDSQGLPAHGNLGGLQHCSPAQEDRACGSQPPPDVVFSSGGAAEGKPPVASSQGALLSTDTDGRKLSPQTSMTAAAAAAAAAIVRGGLIAAVARQRGQHSNSAPDSSLQPLLAAQQDDPASSLLLHGKQQPGQQQHLAPHDLLQPCSNKQAGGSFAAAAGGYGSSSPDSSSAGAGGGGMGPGVLGTGLAHLRTDSQGTAVLREELAAVSLGSADYAWQQQMLAPPADVHMTDAAGTHAQQLQGMQLDVPQQGPCMQSGSPTGAAPAGGFGMQMQLMAAAGLGCAEQGAVQERSPVAEFDSADTAAAAATFEAQLAACCGNKDSQEAVFRAWLDALLPNGEQQQHPQALQQQPMQQQQPQQQPLSASVSPAEHSPAYYEQQQQHLEADEQAPPGFAAGTEDLDAVAAGLHLTAQRVTAQDVQEGGDNSLNPEDDFRELLDLLLDA